MDTDQVSGTIPSNKTIAPIESIFRVDDKVAIVTGASSGLGARFARVLTDAGARVILVARRVDRLEQLASKLDGAWLSVVTLAILTTCNFRSAQH